MRRSWNGRLWPNNWQLKYATTGARLRDAGLFVFPRARTAAVRNIPVALTIAAILAVAVVLIFAGVLPVAKAVLISFVAAGLLIFVVVRQAIRRKTEVIFDFYVAADEVLRESDRKRYHFEVSDVIRCGEDVAASLPDPPALCSFTLGALHNSIGDHIAVVEHLGIAAEEERLKESSHVSPSRKLRRYVKRLRQIERSPQRWPRLSSAINNLEMMQQESAARMLAESQQHLKRLVEAHQHELSTRLHPSSASVTAPDLRPLKPIPAPPPISEVLGDVYHEEPSS